jgi:hypothetical protein
MVTVDVSKLVKRCQAAAKIQREFPRLMVSELRRARDEERATHRYINRTGNLQRSTRVLRGRGSGPDQEWVLEMGEEYAGYVIARGFSEFNKIVADAEDAIANEARKIARAASQ